MPRLNSRSPLQKNAESRDVLHEQLKRRPVPRSGTQNELREKENKHTSTANTSDEGAHFNSGYGTAKSGIRLSRTHRTCARKQTKTDRVNCFKVPKIETTQTTGSCRSKTHKKMRKIMLCVLQRLCTPRGPPAAQAQQPKRRSPSAEAQAQQPPPKVELPMSR